MFDAGLVLEGGGMRGVYTAGVLDFFLDNNISFKDCYAVSAGACHACSYLSGQRKRGLETAVNYLDDKNYCSFYSLFTTGDLFNVKMVYDRIPNELHPYDYEAYLKRETNFYAVVTNCMTGEAEYIPVKDMKKDIIAVRASSSLPLLSRIVEIENHNYLDGGIADSIPIKKSIADGNLKNVVILTQHKGYQKDPTSMMRMIRFKYRKYPKLVDALENRHRMYNDTLRFIEQEEAAGRIFVIRPKSPLEIGRIEKNKEKLLSIYERGFEDAKDYYGDMAEYLDK